MDTYEYDHSVFASDKGDTALYVQFYMHFLKNEPRSLEEGRPIFDDTEFVKIFTPGDRTNIIDRPVRPSDKIRFSKQYAAFKNNQEVQATGTPLSEWPIITRAMAEELKYLGFQTVEQIAGMSDGTAGSKAGLVDLKNKANAYLEVAKGNTAPIEEMTTKMKDLESKIRVLTEALEAQKANATPAKVK